MPDLIITFTDNAFVKSRESNELVATRPFTARVADMNKKAEILDRDDEFAQLSLDPSVYAKTPATGEYGIPYSPVHVGGKRLLPHQIGAVQGFLRELRGFGLLADVVGSGKTYEACAVLSELAAKGKISSALLIVPDQVYDTWIGVLEDRFGLGKGQLFCLGDMFEPEKVCVRGADSLWRPADDKRTMIVKSRDFANWSKEKLTDVLFDVVLVDEAHNLCGEEGEEAKTMFLLSWMMETKKKAEKTYCVLLSATPHAGNLEQMFRLWYFIRCKGGNPADFEEKSDDMRTEEYRDEKAHYLNVVCKGATTVMEFIENVRMKEVTGTHRIRFDHFLKNADKKAVWGGVEAFDALLIGEKKNLIADFLKENPDIRKEVSDAIASAYHDGVLRSIMIRQPHNNLQKTKFIQNVFFFPARNKGMLSCHGLVQGQMIEVDTDNLESDHAIRTRDGDYFSVKKYVETYQGNQTYTHAYAELFFYEGILKALGLTEDAFSKANSLREFYWPQMECIPVDGNVNVRFSPMYGEKVDILEVKLQELKTLLRKHEGERVLVFFDYDAEKSNNRTCDKVLSRLQQDEEFRSRILVGDASDRAEIERRFNEKEDAVLVVVDGGFTEGANLQKSRVIVNFQITPNPLAMEQRIGRIFRLGQEFDVYIYSLADMRALEGYVLMYFTSIGLMTSNSGDAAIISGSNNDKMVTIQCKRCGAVRLLSKDEYDELKKNAPERLLCTAGKNGICTQENPNGTMMVEINSNELKCSHCNKVIKREQDGFYHCFSHVSGERGVYCNFGSEESRRYYCRKICAISHCNKFTKGELKGKCAALALYQEKPKADDAELMQACEMCENKRLCSISCRMGIGPNAISACSTCQESGCAAPRPHVINFEKDAWVADCPGCGGVKTLRPVVAKTFETYVRSAFEYQQDGGKSFCSNLMKETEKVALIREILANDKIRNRDE